MKINIVGTEPQFKIYRMHENIENKYYIGKTSLSIHDRMSKHQNSPIQHSDKHFANVGWNDVTVDIIDTANSNEELTEKEKYYIRGCQGDVNILNSIFYEEKNKRCRGRPKIIHPPKTLGWVRYWSIDENKYILKFE